MADLERILSGLLKHALVIFIKLKGNVLPYISSEIRSLIKTRDYLKSKAVKPGSNYFSKPFFAKLEAKFFPYSRNRDRIAMLVE